MKLGDKARYPIGQDSIPAVYCQDDCGLRVEHEHFAAVCPQCGTYYDPFTDTTHDAHRALYEHHYNEWVNEQPRPISQPRFTKCGHPRGFICERCK